MIRSSLSTDRRGKARGALRMLGAGACGTVVAMAGCAFGSETFLPWLRTAPPGKAYVEPTAAPAVPAAYSGVYRGRIYAPMAQVGGAEAAPGIAQLNESPPQSSRPHRSQNLAQRAAQNPGPRTSSSSAGVSTRGEMVDPFLALEETRRTPATVQPPRAADQDPRFTISPNSQLSRLRRFLTQSDPDASQPTIPRVELGDAVIISDFVDEGRLTIPRERIAARTPLDSRVTSLEQVVVRRPVARANQGAIVPVEISEPRLASDVTGWKPVPEPPTDISTGTSLRASANPVRPIMVVGEQMAGISPRTAAEILADAKLDESEFPRDLTGDADAEPADDERAPDRPAFTLVARAPAPPATRLAEFDADESLPSSRSTAGAGLPLPAKLGLGAGVLALVGAYLRRRRS